MKKWNCNYVEYDEQPTVDVMYQMDEPYTLTKVIFAETETEAFMKFHRWNDDMWWSVGGYRDLVSIEEEPFQEWELKRLQEVGMEV